MLQFERDRIDLPAFLAADLGEPPGDRRISLGLDLLEREQLHLAHPLVHPHAFGEWGVAFTTHYEETHKKQEYVVQYAETDYAFVCRLLEEAGITHLFQFEGGDVKLSQSHADAFAKLRYHVTPNFDVEAGYAFHYFNQREASREDGNYFKLWHNDLKIGLAYRF